MEIQAPVPPSHQMHLNCHTALGCCLKSVVGTTVLIPKRSKRLRATETKAKGNVIKFLKIMKNVINCHIQVLTSTVFKLLTVQEHHPAKI